MCPRNWFISDGYLKAFLTLRLGIDFEKQWKVMHALKWFKEI